MKTDFLDIEMHLSVPYVDPDLGFDISENGQKLAFSWNQTGRWEIYCLELIKGSNNFKSTNINRAFVPRQLTNGDGSKFSPLWRPNRNSLAYALDMDGGENYDIYLYDLDSDQPKNLTPNTKFAIMPTFSWSPDGECLTFCSDQDGIFDTFIIQIDSGSVQKVFVSSYSDWDVKWSPDGNHLAVVSKGMGQDYEIKIINIGNGKTFTIEHEGDSICAKDPSWSHDGTQLAFSSNLNGDYEIGIFNLENRRIRWIASGDEQKEQPEWINDLSLAYVLSRGPACELVIQNLEDHSVTVHSLAPGVIYSPKFTQINAHLYFIFDNPQHPCDIWSFSLEGQSFSQITKSSPDSLENLNLVLPEEILYPGLDSVDVPALLYKPPADNIVAHSNADTCLPPGVLMIHGGPNWLSQITWDPLIQHMIRGWVVFAPNYRGSTGYGRGWQLASRFDFGGVDTDDVVAGYEYLTREKLVHPEKVAVTGRSWGGYLTMTCLTLYPGIWAAGSAVVPFMNWFTAHTNSRADFQHWDIQNFGDPQENYELWYERSPYFFLDEIQAPVQLICGANDVRCPASESLQASEKLLNLSKEFNYVLYPDEGHSLLKKENLVRSKIQQVNFLAKYIDKE